MTLNPEKICEATFTNSRTGVEHQCTKSDNHPGSHRCVCGGEWFASPVPVNASVEPA